MIDTLKEIINVLNSILIEKRNKISNIDKISNAIELVNKDINNIRNIDDFIYDKNIDNIKVLLKGIYDKGLSIELTKEQKEYITNYFNKLKLLKKDYSSESIFEIDLIEKLIIDINNIDIKDIKNKDYDTIFLLINNNNIPYNLKERLVVELLTI